MLILTALLAMQSMAIPADVSNGYFHLEPSGGTARVSFDPGGNGDYRDAPAEIAPFRVLEAGTAATLANGLRFSNARYLRTWALTGGNSAPFDFASDLPPGGTLGQSFRIPTGGRLHEVRALLTRSGVDGSTVTVTLRRGGPHGETIAQWREFPVPKQGDARLQLPEPVAGDRFYLELSDKHGGCYWWGGEKGPFEGGQAYVNGEPLAGSDYRFEYEIADVGSLDWSVTLDGPRLNCRIEPGDHAIDGSEPALALTFPWKRDGYNTTDPNTTPFRYLFTDTGRWLPVHAFKRLEKDWCLERPCEWAQLRGTNGYDLRVTPATGRLLPRMDAHRFHLLLADGASLQVLPPNDQLPDHVPHFFSSDPDLDRPLNEFLLTFLTSHTSCPSSYEWDALKLAWVGGPIHDSLQRVILHYTHRIDPDGYIWSRGESRGWDGRDCSEFDSRHYDSNAPYILACWRWYCWTGDRDFLNKCIETVRRGTDYLLDEMHGRDGLLVIDSPNHTGTGVPGKTSLPSDYWDCIPAGYKVAYINAFYAPALKASAQLEWAVGNAHRADRLEKLVPVAAEAFNDTFWDEDAGRYVGWIDVNGKVHDDGMTYVNTIAATHGLADAQQARRMYQWMENEPTSSGKPDTFTRWIFAPRSNTIHCHEQANRYEYDEWCEDGGAILWTAYYELMSRLRYLGPDNAARRFREILGRFMEPDHLVGGNPLYRGEINNHGDGPGSVGTWGEFPESGIVPCVWLYGFMGVSTDIDGLHISPNLPSALEFAGVDGLVYHGTRLKLTAWRERVRIEAAGATVDLPIPASGALTLTGEKLADLLESG